MPDRSIHDHIAHDLKAALSPIQTAAYVLRRGETLQEGKTAELAAVIERQTRRLARMIDEASEWQRAEEGRLSLRAEPIVPGDLLETALAALDDVPRVRWTTPADVDFSGDSYRLQQMLAAVLAFACRRDPGRAPMVEAEAARERLAWTIIDSGPACDIARLLCRPQVAAADDGLGLGLLLARAIARCHGGDLRASEPAGGGLRLHCEVSSLANAAE